MSEFKQIEIAKLEPHPDNPRIGLREDVVNGICEQIKKTGKLDESGALLVRPLDDDKYQIIKGHQRFEAVVQSGVKLIPCWVEEMDDEEALWRLIADPQAERDPIEVGLGALKIEKATAGRGKTGGISELARELGKTRPYISQVRSAAEVLESVKSVSQLTDFLGKAQHLAAIHKTPKELWAMLAERIITPKMGKDGKKRWLTVNQAQDLSKEICKFEIPRLWDYVFLPLLDVATAYVANQIPLPKTVGELVNLADIVKRDVVEHRRKLDWERFGYSVRGFYNWLSAGRGAYSWEPDELRRYYQKIKEAATEAAKLPKTDPQNGEWYKLGNHILYCGDTSEEEFWDKLPQVPFAFADPPYNAGVDDWDKGFVWEHDWLVEKADVIAVTPGIASIRTFFEKQTKMPYVWSMATWLKNNTKHGPIGFANWIYTAIFCSDSENLPKKQQDHFQVTISTKDTKDSKHKGRKPPQYMQKILELYSKKGDAVIDPFLGSGTTLFEAHKLGRKCIGGEIRPDFCKEILDRWQEDTKIAVEKIER